MGHIRDPAGITRGFLSGRRSTDLDFANEENACAVQCGLSNRRRTTANLTPAPSPLMSESLDTFEGETGMPTESHQPWRATSAWAWGKRGTGRAAQDKRRGGEERTGLSNAELAKEEGTIIASSPSFAEEDMENSHPPCKAERKRRRPPSPPPQADKLQKKKPRRSTKVENTSTVSLTSIAAESVDHIMSTLI